MRTAIRCAGVATAGLVIAMGAAAPAAARPIPTPPAPAAGKFAVTLAASPTTKDLPGKRCELSADAKLTLWGTVDGVAKGTVTATVLATCAEALANPGKFRDVFGFDGRFNGKLGGVPTTGSVRYTGVTAPGGDVRGNIRLDSGTVRASLRAAGTAGVGGSYTGFAFVPTTQ